MHALEKSPAHRQRFWSPDGLVGLDVSAANALEWLSPKSCTEGSKTIDFTSDWSDAPDLALQDIPEITSCKGGRTRTVVKATYDTDNDVLDVESARVEFEFDAARSAEQTAHVTGSIGFSVSKLPGALLGRYVPLWSGSMSTASSGSAFTLIDADLFDGAPAIVLDGDGSSHASEEYMTKLQSIVRLAASINPRLKAFDPIPSGLPDDVTARLGLPQETLLTKTGAIAAENTHTDSKSVVFAAAKTCKSKADCGEAMVATLAEFAASEGVCKNPTVLDNTIFGSLSAAVLMNATAPFHLVKGVRGSAQAVFSCEGDQGYVAVTLDATQEKVDEDNLNWEHTDIFMKDSIAAITMSCSSRVLVAGTRIGIVSQGNNTMMTTLEGDLFSEGRNGVFLTDSSVTEADRDAFLEAVKSVSQLLQTGLPSLDTAIAEAVGSSSADKIFDAYLASTSFPTSHGLWFWWANGVSGIDIISDDSDARNGLIARVEIFLRNKALSLAGTNVLTKGNEVLNKLKDQIGEAAKKFTVYLLDDSKTTVTSSVVDGGVTTTIALPLLHSFKNIRLAYTKEFAMKARVCASWDTSKAENTLATSACIIAYDDGSEMKAFLQEATINDKVENVLSPVAWDIDNNLVYNTAWDKTVLSKVAENYAAAIDGVKKDEERAAEQLRIVSEEKSNVKFSDVVKAVADELKKDGETGSVDGVMKRVTDIVLNTIDPHNNGDLLLLVRLRVDADKGSFGCEFSSFSVRHITADATGGEWRHIIPIERTHVSTPLWSYLLTSATKDDSGSVGAFSQTGKNTLTGWTLPVRSGMRSGTVTGVSETFVDFPGNATIKLTMKGSLQHGGNVVAAFSANMTISEDQADLFRRISIGDDSVNEDPDLHTFSWSFEEEGRGDYAQSVDTLSAVGAYTDYFRFLDAMERFQLDKPISPFAQTLNQFAPLASVWDEPMTWAYVYNSKPLLASIFFSEFPHSAFEEDYNFTVNDELVSSCHMSLPQLTGENVVDEFNKALKSCGDIGSLVHTQFVVNEEDKIRNTVSSGTLQFMPTFPGSIRTFGVTTPAECDSLLCSASWSSASTEPSSLSWNDMYKVVYWGMIQPAGLPYSAPVRRAISVRDYRLVDPSRIDFYPDTFDAVFFPVSLQYSTTADDVLLNSTMTSGTDEVNMSMSDAKVRVQVDTHLSGVYGMSLWCSTGAGNLSLSSSFTNRSLSDNSVVPAEPLNSFVLSASFEVRHSGSARNTEIPELRVVTQPISLTPGARVSDELLRIPSLVSDKDLAQMLATSRDSDNIRYSYRGLYDEPLSENETAQQTVLTIQPFVSDDKSTLFFPLHLEIVRSNIPYWGNSDTSISVHALTNCPLAGNLTAGISLTTDDAVNDQTPFACAGTTGLVDAKASATVHAVQTFSLSAKREMDFTPSLYTALVDKNVFPTLFDSSAVVNTVADVTGFDFQDVTLTASQIKDETIRFSKEFATSFAELFEKALDLYHTMVPANSTFADALKSLIKSTPKHVCEILDLADEALDLFSQNSLTNSTLPLVNEAISPAFEEKISSAIKKIKENICDASGQLSIKPLCKTLSDKWGLQACANIELSEKSLLLYIEAIPRPFKYDASFRFDTSRIFPGLKDIDIGFGSDADFDFVATLGASFGLDFQFVNRDENNTIIGSQVMVAPQEQEVKKLPGIKVALDPKHTFFTAYASVNASTNLKVSFGSISIAFGSAKILVDGRGGANLTEQHKMDVYLDGKAMFAAQATLEPLLDCSIQAGIPSIAGFIKKTTNVTWEEHCKDGVFTDLLKLIVGDQTFANYFANDPALFWKQFAAGLEDGLFRDLVKKLLNVGVSFLGKQIQGLVRKALDAIDGPEIADLVGKQVADMVANVILNHTLPDRSDLERIVLEVFTGILNQRLAPVLRQPIPIPEPNPRDGRYVWALRLGTTTTKVLTNIDFHLGGHGMAQFGVVCQPELQLLWDVKFDVVWTKQKGISIEWPEVPAFGGEVKLDTDQCAIEGRLLFMGAYMQPKIELDAVIRVLPNVNDTHKLRALEFKVDASISGEGELGLVGLLGEVVESVKDSLPALPHVKATFDIHWGIDLVTDHSGKTTPNKFEFGTPELCLGTFITSFMRRITDEVYKVVKPLEPVFGEDGVLMKKIDALKPFLGDKNDLLGILELMCQYFAESCNLDGVRTLIKLLQGLARVIKVIAEIDSWLDNGDEGCASIKMIYETFHIDFSRSDPAPEYDKVSYDPVTGEPVPFNDEGILKFDDNWGDDYKRGVVKDQLSGWKTEGKFAFVVDILHDLPTKIISILLGKDEPLVSFHFPTATFSFLVHWTIPVYPFPYVEIVIAAQAGITFSPPPVALMSSAVIELIQTHNPSYLFRNLAIQTLQDNGEPYWVISGFVQLGGGAAVGLSIYVLKVTGETTLNVRFTASIAPFSVNGDKWTTFDAIATQVAHYGFLQSVAFRLQFDAGFNIALRGCALTWCITIVQFGWEFTIFTRDFIPDKLPDVSTTDGKVNGDAMNFDLITNGYDTFDASKVNYMLYGDASQYTNFTITPSSVMLLPRGVPVGQFAMTRPLIQGGVNEMTFTGDFCRNPVNVHLNGDISFPIMLPDCGNSIANISQGAYESAEDFRLARNSISAGANPAVTFTGAWQSVLLSEPQYGTSYYASGMPPCPVQIETDELSDLQLTGSPADFGGHSLIMTGLLHDATCTAACTDYVVGDNSLSCVDSKTASQGSMNVTFPDAMVELTATSDTLLTQFTVLGTHLGRDVSLTSKSGSSKFIVPELRNVNGRTEFTGNSQGNNDLDLMLSGKDGSPLDVVVTSSSIKMSDKSANSNEDEEVHTVHLTNINYRNVTVFASNNGYAHVNVLEVDDFYALFINSVAQGGSTTVHEITACSTRAKVVVTLEGEGTHEVQILDPTSVRCSLSVISRMKESDGVESSTTLLLNGTEDVRTLSWTISNGHIIAHSLYSTKSAEMLSIDYQNLTHVYNILGPNRNEVTADLRGDAGEFVIDLSANTNGNASVQIAGAEHGVYIRGNLDLSFVGNKYAFDAFRGPVALSGNAAVSVKVESDEDGQQFVMEENCLSEKSSAIINEATVWLQDLMAADGLAYHPSCNLLLNADEKVKQSLTIKTGDGSDSFEATGANIDVSIDLGNGANTLSWINSKNVTLLASLGAGEDKVQLQNTGRVFVDLGDDSAVDAVDIIYSEHSPSVNDNVIYPTGPYDGSVVTLMNWKQQDVIHVKRSHDKAAKKNDQWEASINFTIVASALQYEMDDDSRYYVTGCATGSRLSMIGSNDDFTSKQASVYVSMNDLHDNCDIVVVSKNGANTAVGFVLPDGAAVPTSINIEDSNGGKSGSIQLDGVKLDMDEVEHLEITLPTSSNTPGSVNIDGVPCNADLLISLPQNEWKVDLVRADSNIAVFDGKMTLTEQLLTSQTALVVAGRTQPSTASVSVNNGARSLRLIGGCLSLVDPHTLRPISQWMVDRAKELGVTLKPGASGCDLLVSNINGFEIMNISSLSVGEIDPSVTGDVALHVAPNSDLKLELQPALDPSRDPVSSYTLLNDLHVSGSKVSVSVSGKDYAALHIDRSQSEGKSVAMTLGTPCVFKPDSTIEIDCDSGNKANSSTPFTLNFDGGKSWFNYSSLKFSGDRCSGIVRSVRCDNHIVMPFTTLRGDVDSCDVETTLSSVDKNDVPLRNITLDSDKDEARIVVKENRTVSINNSWPLNKTRTLLFNMVNKSNNVIRVNSNVTDAVVVNICASADSAISFADISSPVTFVNMTIYEVDIKYESINLSKNEAESFCFNSLEECTEGAWLKTLSTGEMCDSRSVQEKCLQQSHIKVYQTGDKASIACGVADYADKTFDSFNSSMVINTNGTVKNLSDLSYPLSMATKAIVFTCGILTAIGATAVVGAIVASVFRFKSQKNIEGPTYVDSSEFMTWCSRMSFRDLLCDQFSWAHIIISACLAAATDVDFSRWGGPVMTVLLETRGFILSSLDACSDKPLAWITPVVIIFWIAAFVSVVLRVVIGVVSCYNKRRQKSLLLMVSDSAMCAEGVFRYIQALCTTFGLVMMPLVCYSLAYLPPESSVYGYVSFSVAALLLLGCQPLGDCGRQLLFNVLISIVTVVLPAVLSLLTGIGLSLGAVVGMSIVLMLLLTVASGFAQWNEFFKPIPIRSPHFYRTYVGVIVLRVASLLCGLVFISMINFTLSDAASYVAVCFWLAWVLLPVLSMIPLVFLTPSAIINKDRSLYSSINGDDDEVEGSNPSERDRLLHDIAK